MSVVRSDEREIAVHWKEEEYVQPSPKFIGQASDAWSMRPMCQAPGVHVVALVPVAGPVPPPSIVVRPL